MERLLISTVVVMLLYMILGYVICKSGKGVVEHAKSLSGILIFVLGPCMLINSFLNLEYSHESMVKLGKFFVVTLIIQLIAFGLLYLILHRKYEDSRYRILSIGGVLGNVGFLGMPIVQSVFPNEPIVACYSAINVMTMNLIVFTVGVFMITNDKKYISLKGAILNPTTISILIALPIFIFRIPLLTEINSIISTLAKMVTPFCMIILGMRLSACKLKNIFTRPFVYATCAVKLVTFPVLAFLLVHWLPFLDSTFKSSVVLLAMTPAGAIIESLAEMHECEQEFAANVVLMTTILSVVTIPIMAIVLV